MFSGRWINGFPRMKEAVRTRPAQNALDAILRLAEMIAQKAIILFVLARRPSRVSFLLNVEQLKSIPGRCRCWGGIGSRGWSV